MSAIALTPGQAELADLLALYHAADQAAPEDPEAAMARGYLVDMLPTDAAAVRALLAMLTEEAADPRRRRRRVAMPAAVG